MGEREPDCVFSERNAETCQKSHNYSRSDVMWARGRATRGARQRQRAGLDVQTAAEISEPVFILLLPRSAHCWSCCTAEGGRGSGPATLHPERHTRGPYLHVRVELGDSPLCDLLLVADEDFS